MRSLLFLLLLFLSAASSAQHPDSTHTIRVHILHGSKPKTTNEYKSIGGYYGGHVVMQLDTFIYGFNYRSRKIHVFAQRKNNSGIVEKENLTEWKNDKKKFKITTFHIPVTAGQLAQLRDDYERYTQKSPYDYAFFGMRCASSCYHMLSRIGITHHCSRSKSIRIAFHPKALRKKLLKLSNEKGYTVTIRKGSATRKWEGD